MDQHDDLFERYFTKRLAPAERDAFDARLENDPVFTASFRDFRSAYDLVVLAGEQDLRARLVRIHVEEERAAEEEHGGRVVPLRRWRWLAAAACIALVAGMAVLYIGERTSPADLYAAHMVPYSAPDIARSDSMPDNVAWTRFAGLYADERFDEAFAALENVPIGAAPDYLLAFYRGQCELLKTRPDPRAAIDAFAHVLGTDNDLHAVATWYTALAALKAGEVDMARVPLDKLAMAGGYKSQEARALSEALAE